MRWSRYVLSRTWAAFVVLCICLGFLADFPGGRPNLEGVMTAIHPMVTALLPYLALGGGIYSGGIVGWWVLSKCIDIRNDGRSVRKFQALSDSIEACRLNLISYAEGSYRLETAYRNTSYQSAVTVEVNQVLNKLERLKIPMPNYTQFEGSERSLYLVAYLSAMEQ